MPQADFVKLITANLVAAILAIGGPILIVWLFVNVPLDADGVPRDISGIVALLGGLTGGAAQYLWQTNTQAATRGQVRNDLLTPANGGDIGN
jgi:hypothetical protein